MQGTCKLRFGAVVSVLFYFEHLYTHWNSGSDQKFETRHLICKVNLKYFQHKI